MEELRNQIRNWYLTYKQQTGKFPSIPSEELGGSGAVIGRQSPLPGSSEGSRSTAPASVDSKVIYVLVPYLRIQNYISTRVTYQII